MDKEATKIVLDYVGHDEVAVRKNAATALALIASDEAVRHLSSMAMVDPDEAVRAWATHELIALPGKLRESAAIDAQGRIGGDARVKEHVEGAFALLAALRRVDPTLSVDRIMLSERARQALTRGMPKNWADFLRMKFSTALATIACGAGGALFAIIVSQIADLRFTSGLIGGWIGQSALLALWVVWLATRRMAPLSAYFDRRLGVLVEAACAAGAALIGGLLLLVLVEVNEANSSAPGLWIAVGVLLCTVVGARLGAMSASVQWPEFGSRRVEFIWAVGLSLVAGSVSFGVAVLLAGLGKALDDSAVRVALVLVVSILPALAILLTLAETRYAQPFPLTKPVRVGALIGGPVVTLTLIVTTLSMVLRTVDVEHHRLPTAGPDGLASGTFLVTTVPFRVTISARDGDRTKVVLHKKELFEESEDLSVHLHEGSDATGADIATFDDPESGCRELGKGEYGVFIDHYGESSRDKVDDMSEVVPRLTRDRHSAKRPLMEQRSLEVSVGSGAKFDSDELCLNKRSPRVGRDGVGRDEMRVASTALGELRRGVTVVVKAPANRSEGPKWVGDMDKYEAMPMVVRAVTDDEPPQFMVRENTYTWDARWIIRLEASASASASQPPPALRPSK